jgi:hypothetical protein
VFHATILARPIQSFFRQAVPGACSLQKQLHERWTLRTDMSELPLFSTRRTLPFQNESPQEVRIRPSPFNGRRLIDRFLKQKKPNPKGDLVVLFKPSRSTTEPPDWIFPFTLTEIYRMSMFLSRFFEHWTLLSFTAPAGQK